MLYLEDHLHGEDASEDVVEVGEDVIPLAVLLRTVSPETRVKGCSSDSKYGTLTWTGSSAASAMLLMMMMTMMKVSKNGNVTMPWMKMRTLKRPNLRQEANKKHTSHKH